MTAGGMIALSLFTGCKKDTANGMYNMENLTADHIGNSIQQVNTTQNAAVLYRIKMMQPGVQSPLQWNKGELTSSEILFDGTLVYGNMLRRVVFGGKAMMEVDLMNPNAMVLGTVNVPYGRYNFGAFELNMNSLATAHSLMLSGTYMLRGQKTPIQLAIDQPVTLTSQELKDVVINSAAYVSTLNIDLGALIDDNLLNEAEVTNGTIVISANSNPVLYKVILMQLQSALSVQFSQEVSNTPVAVSE